jgi:N-acetylmuramoyl-L-alanine amidase
LQRKRASLLPQHTRVFNSARPSISAILFFVTLRISVSAIFLFVVCFSVGIGDALPSLRSVTPTFPTPQSASGSSQNQPVPAPPTSPQQNSISPVAPPAHVGPMIVIDPAHGGTDNGAQGPSGIVEKEVVLRFARQIRAEFERQGFRTVLTRNDDSNPSYEDRAALANAYRDAIFISVHVSSTGKVGTAHVYSYQYSNAVVPVTGTTNSGDGPKSLTIWEEAQRPYLETSHLLADVLQTELAQRFTGSAFTSTPFAIRELRSVSAPAVAVELSSVSVSDPNMLAALGAPLASALVRSVQISRPGLALSRNSNDARAPIAGAN